MKLSHYRSSASIGSGESWQFNMVALREALLRSRSQPSMLRRLSVGEWMHAAIVHGPGVVRDVRDEAVDICSQVYAGAEPSLGDIKLCGFMSFLACCGNADCASLLADSLLSLKTTARGSDIDRRWHFSRAFAGVALGVRAIYRDPAAADVELDELMPFTPRMLYGNNPQALLAHLAAGAENRVPIEDVWPAFREVVHNFPYHEEVGDFDGACLFWIARIVHHQIGGQPLGQTADWLSRHFNAWADGREPPPLGAS